MTVNLKKSIINLANILTLSRFITAPVVLALLINLKTPFVNNYAWHTSLTILIITIFTMLTDLLDGTVARARGEVTNFGKIMDPIADSTFFMTILFAIASSHRFRDIFPIWIPILVLYREICMQILRRYSALKGDTLPAKLSGKIKMFLQGLLSIAFFILLFVYDYAYYLNKKELFDYYYLDNFIYYSGIIFVLANILSLIEYLRGLPNLLSEDN